MQIKLHTPGLRLALTLAAALASSPAWADPYIWLSRDGGSAQTHWGEWMSAGGTPASVPAILEPQAQQADHKPLTVTADGSDFRIDMSNAVQDGDLRFTAKSIGSDGVLTYYEARAGRGQITHGNGLELVPTQANGSTFRLFWQGNPVAASAVEVETSAGWRRSLQAAADGTVSLTSPAFPVLFPSRYVLRVTAKLNGTVTLDGKTYTQVLHIATLSFEVKP